ncbi:MAG: hypothetical protein LBO64_03390 [Desulfovibrio sp.]|jgi:hypothetical protein|nr:hypothetical protein [Desulfovibrio sp.]
MIFDKENLFSMNQAVTATAVSTDIVDLGAGDTGPSEDVSLFVSATTPFTGTGTLVVELHTADANSGTALTSPVTVGTFPITNAALLAGGKLVAARLPHGMKRFARLNYVVTGTVAAGTLMAGLVRDAEAHDYVPLP